jgi:hypothetical protein
MRGAGGGNTVRTPPLTGTFILTSGKSERQYIYSPAGEFLRPRVSRPAACLFAKVLLVFAFCRNTLGVIRSAPA